MAYVLKRDWRPERRDDNLLDSFVGRLVGIFSELTPETVKDKLGHGFASGILLDQRQVECDAFCLLVLANVACFVFEGDDPSTVCSRLLFYV